MIFRILFQALLFLNATCGVYAQEDYSNEDWKALNSYFNEDFTTSISQCRELLKKQPEGKAKNRTRFILARGLIETQQYDEAIELLSITKLDAAFIKSGIPGLIGDCYSEKRQYEQALKFYKKAFRAEWNEETTPTYLSKAAVCAEKLGRFEEGQQFLKTIRLNFLSYSGDPTSSTYVILDSVQPIPLDRPSVTQPSKLGIGTINGKRINQEKFNEALSIARSNEIYKAQYSGNQPREVDEDVVWSRFVSDELEKREHQRLGFHSDEKEFMAYLMGTDGYAPLQEFTTSPTFTDNDGTFRPDKLLARIDEMRHSTSPEQLEAWKDSEEYYTSKLISEKYQKFVSLLFFISSIEVEHQRQDEIKYKIEFRIERFYSIPDSTIVIKHTEIDSAFASRKNKKSDIRLEDTHQVRYIEKKVLPNGKDSSDLYSKIRTIKKSFINSKDDSLFVVNIQENKLRFYTSGPYSTAVHVGHAQSETNKYLTYPARMSNTFERAKVGEVIGPYEYQDHLILAKIIGRTRESIEARHILLDKDYTKEEAQEFLKKVTNENFADLVKEYTQDKATRDKGGELGTFFFGQMVPPFATYCADASIGEIGLVKSRFGYHIVQVTKRSGINFPRLAVVQLPFEVSDQARKEAKDRLNSIRESYIEGKDGLIEESPAKFFSTLAAEQDKTAYRLDLMVNAPSTITIKNDALADSLLKFSFDPKTSDTDISTIYVDGNWMMLAMLSKKAGQINPENGFIRDQLRRDLIKSKKEEILLERLKNYNSSEMERRTYRTNKVSLSKAGFYQGKGYIKEPSVVGKAIYAYNNGVDETYSSGSSGTFYIKVLSKEEPSDEFELETERQSILESRLEFFNKYMRRYLTRSNTVIDNRDLFRIGVRK